MLEIEGIKICGPDVSAPAGLYVRLVPSGNRPISGGRYTQAKGVYGYGTRWDTGAFIRLIREVVTPGIRVADVGAGTGILTILAAKLGASVTAYEIDPMALDVLRENVGISGEGSISIRGEFPGDTRGAQFDLAFANLGKASADLGPALLRVASRVFITGGDGRSTEEVMR